MSKWMIKNKKCNIKRICSAINENETVIKIMLNRNIYTLNGMKHFLKPSFDDLHDPLEMKDIGKAVDIIINSINKKLKILAISDYDVDGIMSVFILCSAIEDCGGSIEYYIPDRVTEGYGINKSIIDKAYKGNYDVIITCDNGIAAIEQIKYAKELGITVIVTDHHDIPFVEDEFQNRKYIVPDADAVVNPKQFDCKYPFKSLCGAGIVFKFVQLLYNKIKGKKQEADKFIEYAAIATICDVVDLADENRFIVKYGLSLLNNTKNLGLKALKEITGVSGKKMNSYIIGFIIGPCFNAAGRLEHASTSLKLLLSDSESKAKELALKLYELNKERQSMTSAGVDEAVKYIENSCTANNKVLVIYLPELHESIAGIVAGRIREIYNLPAILLTKGMNGVKGSGRSIDGYNMFEELLKCKDLLEKFGGHPMAAGLSLKQSNIKTLTKMLNDNCRLKDEDVIPRITIDCQLPFKKITLEFAKKIRSLEPFGKGNPRPIFAEKGVNIINITTLGKKHNVLKLALRKDSVWLNAVMFEGLEEFKKLIGNENNLNRIKFDIVFYVSINEYMGNEYLQLQIKELRKSISQY
ncbi:single-stranded-DNA-specific exonuclease RecJ [Clostridium sp. JN-1]|uniref:single-stranded-DNA-specific exonuclease RecJ n=1 Tax=Clostridium sp. JN-1 TaxID=2483110 RepID=UPI000F0B6945|nr:single-stranded-DNA-specific exonuclease RecJ [Clostridium sp. JN-1]